MESRKKSVSDFQDLQRVATDDHRKYKDRKTRRGQRNIMTWNVIDWVESLKVPPFLSRKLSAGDDIFVITGVRKVLYGTQPAAEAIRIAGMTPPRYLCYVLSGGGCDVIQFFLYILIYWSLQDASLCWALSFGASIVFRHTSHRYLVFGDYVGGYWRSLGRMYVGYSIIIVLSTIFNFLVTTFFKIPHLFAWILTLLWTGVVNYFILKKIWSFNGVSKTDDDFEYDAVSADEPPGSDDIELGSIHR